MEEMVMTEGPNWGKGPFGSMLACRSGRKATVVK